MALVGAALLSGCAARSKAFTHADLEACGPADGRAQALRVVSYNIKSGLESSLDQVGEVLAGLSPDVVALQEVDVGVARTKRVDQARALGERLGMRHVFAGAIKREGGDYGVALLSRLPITRAGRIELSAGFAYEPRVAIDASLCLNGREVRVVSVHADVFPWAAEENTKVLAQEIRTAVGGGILLAGDLNATPREATPDVLAGIGLIDVLRRTAEGPTFRGSDRRLDYIMADKVLDLTVAGGGRVDSPASDHLPVFVDFTPAQ